ncbi:SirB2 family protein [Paludibacterium yongneupense]|uniref:SirB2 family protein n=1 Tax=Paludibacterium yongneupense TaxID=400061 RepID=UPI0003FF078F|nr:SirB2 family protein [Paludibacterium yongneupense]
MNAYLFLKQAHMGFAFTSIALFALRYGAMLCYPRLLGWKIVRIVPHVVDTFLLVCGVALAILLHIDPVRQPWLLAKIAGLIAYVILGTLALKRGKTREARMAAGVLALLAVGYIVAVAFSKRALPF